jgi:YVTN family beta-propeller protein
VIDGSTNTIVATVPTAGYPAGIDVDPVTNRIYVSQQWAGAVRIIDGATNSVITDLQVPGGLQAWSVAINPTTGRLYVVRSVYGDVAVFDAATYTLLATVGGWSGPLWLAVNTETNRIYVADPWNDSVHVIDGASNSVLTTVPVGSTPGIAVNPATNRIYVPVSGTISVIDGVSNTVVDVFAVGGTPYAVGVNPVTNRLYVTDIWNDRVLVLDGATGDLLATLAVPAQPYDIAVIPSTSRIYVMSDSGPAVTVIEDVVYSFSGFFRPVDNTPTLNLAKAGSAIPVKFSLGGEKGLSIFATGYPKSQNVNCDTSTPDAIEETVTAGSSSLSYDPIADQYVYVWKTDKAWAGTCRQLMVRLDDLTDHVANFKFK